MEASEQSKADNSYRQTNYSRIDYFFFFLLPRTVAFDAVRVRLAVEPFLVAFAVFLVAFDVPDGAGARYVRANIGTQWNYLTWRIVASFIIVFRVLGPCIRARHHTPWRRRDAIITALLCERTAIAIPPDQSSHVPRFYLAFLRWTRGLCCSLL